MTFAAATFAAVMFADCVAVWAAAAAVLADVLALSVVAAGAMTIRKNPQINDIYLTFFMHHTIGPCWFQEFLLTSGGVQTQSGNIHRNVRTIRMIYRLVMDINYTW